LLDRIKKTGHSRVLYAEDREDAIRHLISNMTRGDILLTLGAGNVWKIGDEILNKLKEKS